MSAKNILLAMADPQALVDITQALGDKWEATSVASEAEALAQLEQRSFDALVVDFNLGSPDASQLLNLALEKRPETSRFLLAYEADLALVAAYVSGPHEILPKPVEPLSLKSRLDRGVVADDLNCKPSGGEPATDASASSAVPAIYSEVLRALESPGTTNSEVGAIIAGDAALTAEVLKLTQSACPGLPGNLTDPVEAVELLGFEAVKALVMALRFLAEHNQLRPGYLSLDQLWQHSTHVAQLARDLTLFETKDQGLAAEALMAGLLHDLGKVVLATNFDDMYGRVHSLARKQPVALCEIEKEMFGASHGEIGACLVGMWNMPSSVVEAAAFHHEPPLGEHQCLTPLAAVHIANVLQYEIRPSDEFRLAPVVNTAFLDEIGLGQRLPVWRAVLANRWAFSADPVVEPAETRPSQLIAPGLPSPPPLLTPSRLSPPAATTRATTLRQAGSEEGLPAMPPARLKRWVYACAAAAVLGFLGFQLATQPELSIRALAPAPTPAGPRVVLSSLPAPEAASAAVPETAPAMAVSEEAPETDALTALAPPPALPEAEPNVATAPQVAATMAPPPTVVPEQKAKPAFRLSGIIYTAARPAAIVNGETVYVGDRVSGATVVAIDRSQVTLQINGERTTCVFRQELD